MLRLENASLFVGGKLLLNDANLNINRGDRIGIVGRNGCGKTHLMEALAGNASLDSGTRKLENRVKVCLVKQELPDDDQTPLEYLRNNDAELKAFENAENYEMAAELEEERYDTLAPKVLMGLGLTREELDQPMRNLSGGLRMRIGLAMALIFMPEVLLLDEPTNYLDLESTAWLIEYLRNYPASKAFAMVSHDLKLISALTTSTLHLRGGVLTAFGGNYFDFKAQLAIREEKALIKNNALEKQAERKMGVYYAFRDLPASRAAQAVDQKKKADKLREQKVEILEEEPVPCFEFSQPTVLTDPTMELKNACIGYDDKPVLKKLNLSIQCGSRIGLLGRNGEGKSTLIKVLAGKLELLDGELSICPRLRVGYFSQTVEDQLDVNCTLQEQFMKISGVDTIDRCRSFLRPFGFGRRDKLGTLVKDLSGGEKSLLLLALICVTEPELLILDEPTNHLDLETREVLVNAIANFKGSVVLVSHDWDLHEKTMREFWLAKSGTVQAFPKGKGLEHYKKMLEGGDTKQHAKPAAAPATQKKSSKPGLFAEKPTTVAKAPEKRNEPKKPGRKK